MQASTAALAADPNAGKIILMINLSIDLLKLNPGGSILFFIMDDSSDVIVGRMIAKLTKCPKGEALHTDARSARPLTCVRKQVQLLHHTSIDHQAHRIRDERVTCLAADGSVDLPLIYRLPRTVVALCL